jgi:hypothetical protein
MRGRKTGFFDLKKLGEKDAHRKRKSLQVQVQVHNGPNLNGHIPLHFIQNPLKVSSPM